ncbi:MAG TPA: type II toxin-antitoxin system RelE/ParE family toxin [Mucilaginibacter sp.]
MTYTFILKDEAVIDFSDAYAWYEEQKEGLGGEFRAEVFRKLQLICNNPLHYKKSYKNFHEALTDRFPFLIVYTIDVTSSKIIVMAIFHTSRNPKKKFRK